MPTTWRIERPNRHLRPTPPDTSRNQYEHAQADSAWRRAEAEQAAGNTANARMWLERAHRFTPADQNLAFTLATTSLGDGDPAAAEHLFAKIAAQHAVREVFQGWATSAMLAGHPEIAAKAIAGALSGFAANPTTLAIAQRAASATAAAWCAVTAHGTLHIPPGLSPNIRLDGRRITLDAYRQLPPRWRRARTLTVEAPGVTVLGSPIDLAAITRIDGFVEPTPEGIAGWAWHPGAPEADPVLTIRHGTETIIITATDRAVEVSGAVPLAQPRAFRLGLPANQEIQVRGPNGADLWGSPILPPTPPPPAPRARRTQAIAIVIPVYRGHQATLACIQSVLATTTPRDRIIVVNDASPDPALVASLHALAADGRITLTPSCPENPGRNLGFPAAANAGLRAANGSDAVLLNSDTLVFPGWLTLLRAAAHAAPDIGTATPLSNDASIFSYPTPGAPSLMPSPAEGAALAEQAATANPGVLVEVPTAHGFCLFIRADCLYATGLLRTDLFAQGYGEENDFCERARAGGWRHIAVPSVYVAHQGGASFGTARDLLLRRNMAVLEALHPTYHARITAFIQADPLAAARRRLDAARWRAALPANPRAVLLITHDGTGGTGRVLRERAAAVRAQGRMPIIIGANDGFTTVCLADGYPNLRFSLPAEIPALTRLLAHARPEAAELHHLLGHAPEITSLLTRFAVPYDVWIHDWQWICPRLSFITPEGFFCGEAPARDCIACEARGEPPAIPLTAATLRARSATLLAGATSIITASADAAARIRRHFPHTQPTVAPWEPDPPRTSANPPQRGPDGWLTVAVIGALGVEKGYDLLLACGRDAADRRLKLRFAVIGYTTDDTPLLQTGHIFVTGAFTSGQARSLVAASGATLAFIPSIWPETWCYALSDAWEAGLNAVVFDIGAPAERIRRTGRGWLMPLGLSAGRVNDMLLGLVAECSIGQAKDGVLF